MRTWRVVAVSAVGLLGCEAYKKDLDTMCNVRERAQIPATADAATRDELMGKYLMLHVHSPKAKKAFATMGSKTPAEKARVLRAEALAEGLTSCPLADEFDPPSKPAR